ncbi:hypothetical protein K3495_g6492 [Podosphaera aphanis]|nr:hypothetical protein K3495_g6492 [Podosphaera aphanis]
MQRSGLKSHDKDLSDDICPVCKSNRYLNPKLEFFINPECYHKMCSTCVDRIFTSGPASCPVPYCGKTLRKRGFHKAFFGDLKVEREVDIRKRVDAVFDRQQDDFETLLDWNNYLEDVESLIFDLVEGTKDEKIQAEERLRLFRESRKRETQRAQQAGLEALDSQMPDARQQTRSLDPTYLNSRDQTQGHAPSQTLTVDDEAAKITAQTQRIVLSKSSSRRNLKEPSSEMNTYSAEPLAIYGLKKKKTPVADNPYDSFGGIDFIPSRYVLQDDYDNKWLANAIRDERHMAGGYNPHEYYARALFEAFSGLGVFIE